MAVVVDCYYIVLHLSNRVTGSRGANCANNLVMPMHQYFPQQPTVETYPTGKSTSQKYGAK